MIIMNYNLISINQTYFYLFERCEILKRIGGCAVLAHPAPIFLRRSLMHLIFQVVYLNSKFI